VGKVEIVESWILLGLVMIVEKTVEGKIVEDLEPVEKDL
jgi:hypothetical protein